MSNNERSIDQRNNLSLHQSLSERIDYLSQMRSALKKHNDLLIYKLLDPVSYHGVVKHSSTDVDQVNHYQLVGDLANQLGHYLSTRLISYLGEEYPSFYYEEYQLGKFNIYFGNWWDHRLFGKLDVLHLKFIFKKDEFNKLKTTFNLASSAHDEINSEEIRKLIKKSHQLKHLVVLQGKRDNKAHQLKGALKANDSKSKLPWTNNKIKSEHQKILKELKQIKTKDKKSVHAKKQIHQNELRILTLSKEDTILGYEKQSVEQKFDNFSAFAKRTRQLYHDYILNLAKGTQVQDDNE